VLEVRRPRAHERSERARSPVGDGCVQARLPQPVDRGVGIADRGLHHQQHAAWREVRRRLAAEPVDEPAAIPAALPGPGHAPGLGVGERGNVRRVGGDQVEALAGDRREHVTAAHLHPCTGDPRVQPGAADRSP
jgi:hypothetical protein